MRWHRRSEPTTRISRDAYHLDRTMFGILTRINDTLNRLERTMATTQAQLDAALTGLTANVGTAKQPDSQTQIVGLAPRVTIRCLTRRRASARCHAASSLGSVSSSSPKMAWASPAFIALVVWGAGEHLAYFFKTKKICGSQCFARLQKTINFDRLELSKEIKHRS